ncbi:hypothetical protein AAHC03_024200 [Spirometra sp. Aus1]
MFFFSFRSSRELIPEVWTSQKHRKRSVSLPPPSPPGPIKLLAATEDSAHLEWQPPAQSPHTSDPINYRVEIIPENSPRTFSMLTQEPQLSLEELRPAKSYDVRVYTYRPTDDQVSSEASHLRITTKPEVVRLPMVQNPKAESTDFAALKISWEPPTVDRTDRPELQINHYSVMLLNLALGRPGAHSSWTQSSEAKWSRFDVPGGFRTTSYVISGLQPDSFYKIRIFAVSNANIDGHPAVITSSPRIISRPPSGPPTKITLTHVGALTAMFSWREPEAANENGEIVAYQLAFNSPEWLSPREVTVSDSLNYTLTGLNPATNYTMAIAAATRAGIGPQSKLLHFQTTSRKTVLDTHRPQTEETFEENGAVDSNAVVPSLVKIHNLRYITNERSILLLWSMPPTAGTAQEYRGCVIRWGPLYPGPSEAYVGLEKRAYSIEHLEPATSYLISIALLSDDGEGPSEMITAQTKPRSHGKEALIPVNLQAISVGYDWAVLTWDPPTCSSFDEGGSGSSRRAQQRASPCASELYPLQYQLRYQLLEPNSLDASQSPEKADGFVNCPTDAEAIETEVNTTVPWARLEGLKPGNRYVACVRAFSVNTQKSGATSQSRVGDWSLVQIFETTVKKSTISIDGSDAQPMLDSKVFDASPRDRTPGDPDLPLSADPRSAAGEQRSNSLNNSSDSNLWLLTPTIVVVSVLLVSVVSLVCWLKRRSFMIVRYKPDPSAEATTNGTNVCLLTPAKQANNVVGVDEKTATATMEKSVKEGHMLEYLQHQQQSQPPGHTVGIPSVVDPMGHGSSADAASRGATGSSISSVVSLLSPVKHSAAYFTTSPLSNAPPMQSQLSDVTRYTYPPPDPCRPVMVAQPGGLPGYQPTCPPPPGTAAFYTGGTGGYAQPTPHDAVPLNYCPTGGNFIRANLPPVPFLARPTDGDGVVRSGPRIDLGAGENEDTYLQHPGVPLSRAHGTLSGPGVTASDLISETSSGLLSSAFGAGHPVFQSTGGFNPSEGSGTANAYFGESSTVSSTSNSSHRFGSLPPTCATGLPPMAQPPPLPMHQSARKASLGANAGAGRILSTQKETDSEAPAPHQKQQQQQQQQQQRLSVKRTGPSSESKASTPRKNASTKMTKSTSANMPKAISTEELTQEMANLDGLMKDLSLITQNEFGC